MFDETRNALIERNICFNANEKPKPYENDYLLDLWSKLPHHEQALLLTNKCTEYGVELVKGLPPEDIPINLNYTIMCNAFLCAFGHLSLAKRLCYTMVLLYCTQPDHKIDIEKIPFSVLSFLVASQLLDINKEGFPVTTKQGAHFLVRFFDSEDLRAEFQ